MNVYYFYILFENIGYVIILFFRIELNKTVSGNTRYKITFLLNFMTVTAAVVDVLNVKAGLSECSEKMLVVYIPTSLKSLL